MSDENVAEEAVEKKKEMRVRVCKLQSGEEIVTAIEGVSDEGGVRFYLCLDPAFPAADPQDPSRMKFMPWMMFAADREFIISRNDMMCEPKTVDEQIEGEYKSYFAQGMELDAEKAAAEEGQSSIILTPPEKKVVTLK